MGALSLIGCRQNLGIVTPPCRTLYWRKETRAKASLLLARQRPHGLAAHVLYLHEKCDSFGPGGRGAPQECPNLTPAGRGCGAAKREISLTLTLLWARRPLSRC